MFIINEIPHYRACTIPQDELPACNPDTVIITCELFAGSHGFKLNSPAAVLKSEITVRDRNGFDIRVFSNIWNHDVWVSSSEYSISSEK